ncbi:GDSL esterase/lipase [Platanthera guangdongensis]|uniref:GDSL esterase/lipase n=1 Tax=Platanthera guangdongensis TaxID=2320717 RepID=A0ABR2MY40_9ASPA
MLQQRSGDGHSPVRADFVDVRGSVKYLFWDPYHPTEGVNIIAAKHFLDGDDQHISPMNLRQLKQL